MPKTKAPPVESFVGDVISGKRLTAITGLSDRRHRQLAEEGWIPAPREGMYLTDQSLRGMYKYLKAQAAKKGDNMAAEKLKKLKAERKLVEINLDRARKEALDASTVFSVWEGLLMNFRQKLLRTPSKIAPRLAFMESQVEVEQELEKELCEALDEMSKPMSYEWTEELQEGNGQAAELPEAPAKADSSKVG